jgi:hypothetical protein
MISTAETRSAMGRASQYRISSRIAPSNVILTAIRDVARELALESRVHLGPCVDSATLLIAFAVPVILRPRRAREH